MTDINPVNMGGVNPQKPVEQSEQVKKENSEPSIFSGYDKNQDSIVTSEEMGIKKVLEKALDMLPNSAKNSKVANALKQIGKSIEKLGENITYDAQDSNALDNVSREVTARIEDAENLAKIVKKLNKGDAGNAANDFNNLELKSDAVKTALGAENVEEHNEDAQNNITDKAVQEEMNNALNKAVQLMKSTGDINEDIDLSQIPIQKIKGLTLTNIKATRQLDFEDGTLNDSRRSDGSIDRATDRIKVQLVGTYTQDGVSKPVTVETVFTPSQKYDTGNTYNDGKSIDFSVDEGFEIL